MYHNKRCEVSAAKRKSCHQRRRSCSYNIPVYRITKNDILNLNIVTTPKGDAAQFYSAYNTSGGVNAGAGTSTALSGGGTGGGGGIRGGNMNFYFNGLKVDSTVISMFLE